ncbi:MAG: nucleoside 2-deoxyribosyltransferase [Proteobacteria bacterium]|nr:nucleoside 2-deoxyribosyltransferase [Pseudomonadota bacterium]
MTPSYSLYFAGAMFNHKDLTGNAILAETIERYSDGRYTCLLPQDLSTNEQGLEEIRNLDLKAVLECDLALFNFDGSDLDSGTVVEFMFAKFLDIPVVIFRSDFRSSGDQGETGDNWNLMCSFFPRTRSVQLNSLECYRQAKADATSPQNAQNELYRKIASLLIENLDAVRNEPPLPKGNKVTAESIYQWAFQMPGRRFANLCSEPDFLQKLLATKAQKGLI